MISSRRLSSETVSSAIFAQRDHRVLVVVPLDGQRGAAGDLTRPLRGDQHQFEAVRDLGDTIFNGNARHLQQPFAYFRGLEGGLYWTGAKSTSVCADLIPIKRDYGSSKLARKKIPQKCLYLYKNYVTFKKIFREVNMTPQSTYDAAIAAAPFVKKFVSARNDEKRWQAIHGMGNLIAQNPSHAVYINCATFALSDQMEDPKFRDSVKRDSLDRLMNTARSERLSPDTFPLFDKICELAGQLENPARSKEIRAEATGIIIETARAAVTRNPEYAASLYEQIFELAATQEDPDARRTVRITGTMGLLGIATAHPYQAAEIQNTLLSLADKFEDASDQHNVRQDALDLPKSWEPRPTPTETPVFRTTYRKAANMAAP